MSSFMLHCDIKNLFIHIYTVLYSLFVYIHIHILIYT